MKERTMIRPTLVFPDCMTEVTGNRKKALLRHLLIETCLDEEPWQPRIFPIIKHKTEDMPLPITTYHCDPDVVISICDLDKDGKLFVNSIFTVGYDLRGPVRASYLAARQPAMMYEEDDGVLIAYPKPQNLMWHLMNIGRELMDSRRLVRSQDFSLYRMDKEAAEMLFLNFKPRTIPCNCD